MRKGKTVARSARVLTVGAKLRVHNCNSQLHLRLPCARTPAPGHGGGSPTRHRAPGASRSPLTAGRGAGGRLFRRTAHASRDTGHGSRSRRFLLAFLTLHYSTRRCPAHLRPPDLAVGPRNERRRIAEAGANLSLARRPRAGHGTQEGPRGVGRGGRPLALGQVELGHPLLHLTGRDTPQPLRLGSAALAARGVRRGIEGELALWLDVELCRDAPHDAERVLRPAHLEQLEPVPIRLAGGRSVGRRGRAEGPRRSPPQPKGLHVAGRLTDHGAVVGRGRLPPAERVQRRAAPEQRELLRLPRSPEVTRDCSRLRWDWFETRESAPPGSRRTPPPPCSARRSAAGRAARARAGRGRSASTRG